ncbi:hypothetical protein [Baekduia sp.]|jgi:hypothetical protein|uniref:hypothetical protein n=1 Tax=Baekduia sp. TaxID=2600305 RepID=UPI002E0B2F8E|nr:hypothetical protein [Baekduia sp.]
MTAVSLRRATTIAVLALVSLATVPVAALAHGGNPNFRSVFHGLSTPLPGVQVQVIGYDSLYELRSSAKQPVTIYGYDGEPYSRILPDGTVQQNTNSPAVYLNNDEFGTAPVPAHAHKGAPVVWKTVDKTATITWHDHRMHYIGKGTPPKVTDTHKKTKIFDYTIPLSEGSTKSNITGTLFWVGPAGGGFPVGAGIAFAVILLGSAVLVVTVRRRRAATAGEGPESGDDGDGTAPTAVDPSEPAGTGGRKEAW